jgi:hypothetical protein
MATTIEPTPQNLPFGGTDKKPSFVAAQEKHLLNPRNDFDKSWRLCLLGGTASVVIGGSAIVTYRVPAPEAAAAASAWLIITYVAGRTAVHLINSLVKPVPRESHSVPAWMHRAAGTILAGFVCEFLATTVALAALFYSQLPLPWAVHPALVLCGVFASIGFCLISVAIFFVCFRSGVLDLLVIAVECELVKMSIFIAAYGGSHRGSALAHAHAASLSRRRL